MFQHLLPLRFYFLLHGRGRWELDYLEQKPWLLLARDTLKKNKNKKIKTNRVQVQVLKRKSSVPAAFETGCDSREDAQILQEVEFFFCFFSPLFFNAAAVATSYQDLSSPMPKPLFLRQCRNAPAALTRRLYLRPHRGCNLPPLPPPPPPPRPEALKRALYGERGTSEISQATGAL